MSQSTRFAAVALAASFTVAPAFAQGDPAGMICSDYASMTQEQQMEALQTMLSETMGAEANAEEAEIHSLLLEACNANPDSMAIEQLQELPLAVQE